MDTDEKEPFDVDSKKQDIKFAEIDVPEVTDKVEDAKILV